MQTVVGIDASRNRSGGAVAHLVGLLGDADPQRHGIREIHLWAYKSLSDSVPDRPWLVKHTPAVLQRSLLHQLWWQYHSLPREACACGCAVLFNTDAGSVCPFQPAVTLSQDMLSYEVGEMKRFGLSLAWLRLLLLRYIQAASLRNATGAIFLTRYAASVIQRTTGPLTRVRIIPHGVGDEFLRVPAPDPWPRDPSQGIRCLYVSNAAMYKHQWHVVRAIGSLRQKGHPISLILVGGGRGRAQDMLAREIEVTDPQGEFVQQIGFVSHDKIPSFLVEADIFVFASSCENMPVTLLEAMAAGLPIGCSERGPMPEILADGGLYFNPEDPNSIAARVEEIINDSALRQRMMSRVRKLAAQYTWAKCSTETLRFLNECAIQE